MCLTGFTDECPKFSIFHQRNNLFFNEYTMLNFNVGGLEL